MLTAEANIPTAKRFRQYRKLIGMKQKEAAELFHINQGNYSKMEHGLLAISEERLKTMKAMFIAWRIQEVRRLKNRIEELENID